MRSRMRSIAALAGLLGMLPVLADETPIQIDTDLDGDYFIVERSGDGGKPVLVVKRALPDYVYFTKREFDCAAHTVRYLGEGESLDAVAKSEAEAEMGAIEPDSISDQLAKLVCGKAQPASK